MAPINWQEVGGQAASLLSRYITIDTTNPPGNEAQAATFLADLLRARGLEPTVYTPGPGRANLIARLRGTGEQKPLLLLHHMDVVPAEKDAWGHDPFGGEIEDGYVYGRGALDMKSQGIMSLLALDLLRASGCTLTRDVIWMAVSDEEMSGLAGTGWMVEHHWAEIAPEFVWDEGGFGLSGVGVASRNGAGSAPAFYVAVAEKQVLWPQLVAQGEPGLASVPRGPSSVSRLIQALERIRRHPNPSRLTPVTREMLACLAEQMAFPRSFLLRHAGHPLFWPLVCSALAREPEIHAALCNLVTVTRLQAGSKENVIPGRATAVLDVRLLPDEDPDAFMARLAAQIDDPQIQIELPFSSQRTVVSPRSGPFYELLQQVLLENVPGCVVVPMLTPGGTDSRFFRQRGVAAYGLVPVAIDRSELARMHGVDERISIDNLCLGTRVFYQVLCGLCCAG